ncbi:sclerostin [Ahaetulla prasina]|uniref:sclerostin n=1 Tax=Ahaetulla prasina TaxID=499056 RepID=UPI0026471255|nr:sclerostin [Ahaetulla prasina]
MPIFRGMASFGLLLFFLQINLHIGRSWQVLKNDAAEFIPDFLDKTFGAAEQPVQAAFAYNETEITSNRAHQERRNSQVPSGRMEPLQFGCREVYSTRYVTSGPCRSTKPIKELVCSGQCLPTHLLPNSIGKGKWWRQHAMDYRCIPAQGQFQRVQLACPGEDIQFIKARIITSCKCKRYTRYHNRSQLKDFSKETTRPQRNKKPRVPRARGSKTNQVELENSF